MGNNSCVECSKEHDKESINSRLTEEQINLIQNSWKLLKNDLPHIGVIVFKRFFQVNPDLKDIFPKIITINQENRLEFEIDDKMLEKHSTRVMEALGAVVDSLNNPYVLGNVLKALGQTHTRRQIKPIMLKKLWPPLDYGFSEHLAAVYTKECAVAWKQLYEFICVRMKTNMKFTENELT